jgi:1,4-dihydroxy-2-naphthoate octaprenyltransferase
MMVKRYLSTLISMSRPSQLLVVTLVYFLGNTIAMARDYLFEINPILWGYAALFPISMSIHYINEYADYATDTLTVRTPFSGGSGALQRSGLPPSLAHQSAWVTLIFGVGIALWGFITQQLSSTALFILIIGAFFGWMYSVRPLALAWHGWGELDNASIGAVLLPLFGYAILAGRIDLSAFLAVIPFGMVAFVNLLATTWADRKADSRVGKYTLATRWSPQKLRIVYWLVAGSSFILIPLLKDWVLPTIVVWSSILVYPSVIWGAATYTRQHSPFPTVTAMVLMLIAQLTGWGIVFLSSKT